MLRTCVVAHKNHIEALPYSKMPEGKTAWFMENDLLSNVYAHGFGGHIKMAVALDSLQQHASSHHVAANACLDVRHIHVGYSS